MYPVEHNFRYEHLLGKTIKGENKKSSIFQCITLLLTRATRQSVNACNYGFNRPIAEIEMSTANAPQLHDPFRHWISIVGMGAAGAGHFRALVERLQNYDLAQNVGILLLDGRPVNEFGRGVAWSSIQHDLFRANMRVHTIGFRKALIDKIAAATGMDPMDTPDQLSDNVLFQTRKVIGDVLHQDFEDTLASARQSGILCVLKETNIVDITTFHHGYCLEDSEGNSHFSHTVVLGLGNVPNYEFKKFRGTSGYIHNPWAWAEYSNIPDKSDIAVIGLGPTAVDSILLLNEQNPKSIAAFSRSGRMQYPRPHNEPHVLQALSPSRIQETKDLMDEHGLGGFDYPQLLSLLNDEFNKAGACPGWNTAKANSRLLPREALYKGLSDADKVAPWYSIMKEIDPITPFIWNALSETGKAMYKAKDRHDHTNLSYGMASVQAKKILECIDDKKLQIFGGLEALEHNGEKFIVKFKTKGSDEISEKSFDIVVNATGIGSDIAETINPLVISLRDKGWIKPHPHGGAIVNFDSGQILNNGGKPIGEIYSLAGSLTYGTHLLTHCLWQVWDSGERTASSIVKNVMRTAPRTDINFGG